MNPGTELEAFLFRAATMNRALNVESPPERRSASAIEQFSEDARLQAASMGRVYQLLYCLENSIRELVETTLIEAHGVENWWSSGVSENIRKSAERRQRDDQKNRWHGARGNSVLAYVDFPQYGSIITEQWEHFEALLGDKGWVLYYFEELNHTRRALAHTGKVTEADEERMEVRVRDWLRAVG